MKLVPSSVCPWCGAAIWIDRSEVDDETRTDPPTPRFSCNCRNMIYYRWPVQIPPAQPTVDPFKPYYPPQPYFPGPWYYIGDPITPLYWTGDPLNAPNTNGTVPKYRTSTNPTVATCP